MKQIEVWADWYFLEKPQKVGVLTAAVVRGKEVFAFDYEEEWLRSRHAFQIDPQLRLFSGRFFVPGEYENFGVFLDSLPDRWGRTLMLRRETALSRNEKRPVKSLLPSDYLLGVHDQTRMGALRFKIKDGPFLADYENFLIPPWTSLRELERASLFIERENSADKPEFLKRLDILIAPGSSLGGARPKASVVDQNGSLWIAKFPSGNDLDDVGAWEAVIYEMAKRCDLNVVNIHAQRISGRHHIFMTKRFDRLAGGKRIHFSSAMTLLEYQDGDNFQNGVSYLEFADFIVSKGAPSKVGRDLEELWRRIVFSIAVSNSDDHLRNHGFLLSDEGWELSPVYDINPNAMAVGLSLNISKDDNSLDFDLAKSVAPYFRVSEPKADLIIEKIKLEIKNWDKIAEKYEISRAERIRMEKAFHY